MSRDARSVYHYSTLMLGDLGPRQPTVRGWPCYLWPPPQLIVGYPYFVRVCHDYAFDRRTFSLLGFRERRARQSRTLDWQCLGSCSYDINVGAYLRFLDIDDFEETLTQIQQSLLSDRIVADLQLADPLAGVGLWRLPGDDLRGAGQPESSAAASTPSLQALLHRRFRHLQDCGPAVWGLCERSAALPADPEAEPSPAPPQDVLGVIRRLRSAYFRFLLLHQQRRRRRPEPPTAPPTVRDEFLRYLPHRGDPPLDPNQHSPWTSQDWLSRFVEAFAIPLRGDERLVGEVPSQPDERTAEMLFMADDGPASRKEQTLVTLRTVIDALSLPHRLPPNRRRELVGGAVQLRPRVNGRAVTATMRQQRGQVVQRFIDSLPLPTRRRRRPPPAAQVISESETEEEEEEDSDDDDEEDDIYADMPPLEGDEDEDAWWVADPRERDRRRRRRDRQENAWLREVRAAVAEAVRLLQDELAVERGNWEPTFLNSPEIFTKPCAGCRRPTTSTRPRSDAGSSTSSSASISPPLSIISTSVWSVSPTPPGTSASSAPRWSSAPSPPTDGQPSPGSGTRASANTASSRSCSASPATSAPSSRAPESTPSTTKPSSTSSKTSPGRKTRARSRTSSIR